MTELILIAGETAWELGWEEGYYLDDNLVIAIDRDRYSEEPGAGYVADYIVKVDAPEHNLARVVPLPPAGLRMTKAVAAAWQASTRDQKAWLIQFGPLDNVDKVVKWLSADVMPIKLGTIHRHRRSRPTEAALFLAMGQDVLLRMLQVKTYKHNGEVRQVEDWVISDSVTSFNRILELGAVPDLGRVRCWYSLHNSLSTQAINAEPDFDLVVTAELEAADGLAGDDWKLVVPRTSRTLKIWGHELKHCVGGYGNWFNDHGCYILGVEVAGAMTYTVEIRAVNTEFDDEGNELTTLVTDSTDRYVNQFFGWDNTPAPVDVQAPIKAALRQAGLIS